MFRTRPLAIAQRAVRTRTTTVTRNVRFASDTASTAAQSPGSTGAITGGLVGGGVALAVMYGYYQYSGLATAVQTAKQAKSYTDSVANSLKVQFKENTPDTNEALQTLKEAVQKYAAFIPGARAYVDSAFNDLESIRKKHGQEVDEIVSEAYSDLREVSKKGMSMETAGQAWSTLAKHLERLLGLTKDAAEDIMNNHPQLKEKLGGSADQLKQFGDKLGPEVKKQIDDTWKQVEDIIKTGWSPENIEKIRTLVQDKVKKLRELSNEATGEGRKVVDQAKEQGKEVVDQAKEQGKEAVGQAKEQGKEVANQVKKGTS